jgi:MFS family permease
LEARRALFAAGLGWGLDAFDVMLFALVLTSLMTDLGMSRATAGILGSLTLLASAAGGVLFGFVADRYGRTRALTASILIYSVFSGASGLAQTAVQLAVFRFLLGLGMGGEWASGAALVSETWGPQHRGKALALMQSCWSIGYAAAAATTALVLPSWGWRAVFFVGILPALFTLWVRRHVQEPEIWLRSRSAGPAPTASSEQDDDGGMFSGPLLPVTIVATSMNALTLFGWWGFNLWLPAYLSLPTDQGGIGLSARAMSASVIAMQVGMWFGYVTFGYVSDVVGRRRTYVGFLVTASALMLAYANIPNAAVLFVLGPLLAFFATGYFSGFGALTAEIYPTRIRARAQGFTYNVGRVTSALAPFMVGSLATTQGFGVAFGIVAAAFLLAAVLWRWLPETRGRELR